MRNYGYVTVNPSDYAIVFKNGNIIKETSHDLNGKPALNARGFYQAEYSWDEYGNMLTEAYLESGCSLSCLQV